MSSILYNYTPEELQNLLDSSNSYSDLLRKIGLNPKGGNPKTLKRIIKEFNLDETKINENRSQLYAECAKKANSLMRTPLEDVLNNKATIRIQSAKLLRRLVQENYKQYYCEICGISEWMGYPISLQLHHKNGNHDDNSLENLQILCPNCHSQTDNYSGKSSRKKIRSK